MRCLSRGLLAVFALVLLSSCRDAVVTPIDPPLSGGSSRVLGLVEVTISGLGTEQMSASAAVPAGAGGANLDLSPLPSGGSSPGTIQLQPLSTGSFTSGVRGSGGERYLYATFRVRNAGSDGTPYASARHNLTFVAVRTSTSLQQSAVSSLGRFDGSPANPAIASTVMPTGAVYQERDGSRTARFPDVLQIFSENEAAELGTPGTVTSVMPYGFVVSNASTPHSRMLPANPAADQYDGVVTFAFRVPLQPTAAQDPFTISAVFLAVDDAVTRITQSYEEQDSVGQSAFEARADALSAERVTLLPGGNYTGSLPVRTLCTVRTAGASGAPGATLVNVAEPCGPNRTAPAANNDVFSAGGGVLGVDAASGLLANDTLGTPQAAVVSFGGGSLGGNVDDLAADSTIAPLPGHSDGSLSVATDGSLSFTAPGSFGGTFTFSYRIGNEVGTSTATVTIAVGPQITGISPATLVPGDTATLNGLEFNAVAANNAVTIGGVAATVASVTSTSLRVVVPCVGSGNVAVRVTTGGRQSEALDHPLQARQRTLQVGESIVVTSASEVECNELPPTGQASRYVVAVYSTSTTPNSDSPFILSSDHAAGGHPPLTELARSTSAAHLDEVRTPTGQSGHLHPPGSDDPHLNLLEKNREAYARLHTRFRNDARMQVSRDVVAADPVEPPLTRTFRVSNINPPAGQNVCSSYYVASATRVYYDGKLAIYEDDATPNAFKASQNATMALNYQRIGDQFNADMEPIVRSHFGDVLRRDAITDNNGALVALFTPLLNNNFSGVAGFVVTCDQFPNDDTNNPGVGGPYTSSAGSAGNGASNFGEYFYAYQPVVEGTGFSGNTAENWYRTIRSTFIHEAKHVASQAARVANNSPTWESAWLEEGTARHAEELWMRYAVDNVAWKANTGYGSPTNLINVYCDVRPGSAECDANPRRPASIMQRHFTSLYTYLNVTNGRLLSPFGATSSDNATYWYALSWSLVRYAIDRYGTSDADFLTALNEATTSGVTNLTARAGVSIATLLGQWALSFALDDHPDIASPSLDTQVPTWNLRSIYAGLNSDFPSTYTRVYPLVPSALSLGSFTAPTATNVRGGGVLWYELSGTHTAPQLLRLRGNNAALPSTIRIAIARVQ